MDALTGRSTADAPEPSPTAAAGSCWTTARRGPPAGDASCRARLHARGHRSRALLGLRAMRGLLPHAGAAQSRQSAGGRTLLEFDAALCRDCGTCPTPALSAPSPRGDAHRIELFALEPRAIVIPKRRVLPSPLTADDSQHRPLLPYPSSERNRHHDAPLRQRLHGGCHPLSRTPGRHQLRQTSGNGTDEVVAARRPRSASAKRGACPHASVYFLVGGTQAQTPAAADQILRPWEGIVSATTGHITAHESRRWWRRAAQGTLRCPARRQAGPDDEVRSACARRTGATENAETSLAPGACTSRTPPSTAPLYSLAELEAFGAGVPRLRPEAVPGTGARPEATNAWPAVGRRPSRWARHRPLVATRSTSAARRGARSAARPVVFTKPGLDDHFFTSAGRSAGRCWRKGRLSGICSSTCCSVQGGRRAALPQRSGPPRRRELAQRIAEGFRAKGTTSWPDDSPANQRVRHPGRTRRRSAWPNMRRSASGSARPTACTVASRLRHRWAPVSRKR